MAEPHFGTAEDRALGAFARLRLCSARVSARLGGFGSQLAAAGLTQSQFDVLAAVFRRGPSQPQDLARSQWFTEGNLSLVLHHLERSGWVRRRRLDKDRRFIVVQITEAGRALMSELLPQHARAVSELFAVLTAAEQDELKRLCGKLAGLTP